MAYRQIGFSLEPPAVPEWIGERIVWEPEGWGKYTNIPELFKLYRPWLPWWGDSWAFAMIMAIRPGGYIPFHRDTPGSATSLDRVHFVLATNPDAWVLHDGTWERLSRGVYYLMDPFKEHAAINEGETVRLHLVVDAAHF